MKINTTLVFTCFILALSNNIYSQIGGDNVYEFINLSPSAQVTALGGSLISVADDEVALGFDNPALLHDEMHQQLSFNHNLFLADIQHGFAGYGHHVKKWDATFLGGMQYISYGSFDAADEQGNINGTFNAAEYGLTIGASKQLYDKMRLGANLKMIASQFEGFDSYGMLADVGAYYQDTTGTFSAGLVFKNIGTQFTTYREDNREDVGFDIQLGVSKKLKYLPFRFSVIAHNLQRWNILYDDPNQEEATFFGDQAPADNKGKDIVDNLFRHLIFNGEFILGKRDNFRIRIGYNHLRRSEMRVNNLRSIAGFSGGIGLKINRFKISYGRSVYHIAGGANHISISTNLKEFGKN